VKHASCAAELGLGGRSVGVVGGTTKMATGCCGGAKKPKLNGSTTIPVPHSAPGHPVIRPEMCYYCFDVLNSFLHGLDSPRTPSFTNDS
jgi:hypothetical protein